MTNESPIGQRWKVMQSALNERQRRLLVAVEAKVLGRGGVSAVSVATGVSRSTIKAGLNELALIDDQPPSMHLRYTFTPTPRTRRVGGGRKKLATTDKTLLSDLLALVESTTRGDPQSPLRWTCKSLRNLADELKAQGHTISHVAVGRRLKGQEVKQDRTPLVLVHYDELL